MPRSTAHGADDIPAVSREVYDVSGAGDTVIATLGALLGAGAALHSAVRSANEAAGVVVGKLGTAVVTPDELAYLSRGRGQSQDCLQLHRVRRPEPQVAWAVSALHVL